MKDQVSPITLTTDFGHQDEYVGVMKGVILSINKKIPIIDLVHTIAPQNIRQGALILKNNYTYFPEGTVHLVVVDPGVGSSRRIIAFQNSGQIFIGPDNGIFTPFFVNQDPFDVYVVENEQLFLSSISKTFHGRDIMAPVAARLASGMDIADVGPQITSHSCAIISLRNPVLQRNGVTGEVITIDNFGNIRTNITLAYLNEIDLGDKPCITLKSYTFGFIDGSYKDIDSDMPTGIINSSGELEVCVKNGNAARLLKTNKGERVFVHGHLSGCQGEDIFV